MARTKISSTDLIWIFHQKMAVFEDCPHYKISIAIVPTPNAGWKALTTRSVQVRRPLWARRIEAIQNELREVYQLAND